MWTLPYTILYKKQQKWKKRQRWFWNNRELYVYMCVPMGGMKWKLNRVFNFCIGNCLIWFFDMHTHTQVHCTLTGHGHLVVNAQIKSNCEQIEIETAKSNETKKYNHLFIEAKANLLNSILSICAEYRFDKHHAALCTVPFGIDCQIFLLLVLRYGS